jgi:hypothetical protein
MATNKITGKENLLLRKPLILKDLPPPENGKGFLKNDELLILVTPKKLKNMLTILAFCHPSSRSKKTIFIKSKILNQN